MTQLSAATEELLARIETFSGHALTQKGDLGILMEMATQTESQRQLEELAFLAKFLVRTFGIMKRIGRDGEGYDRLSNEFGASLERASGLIRLLITGTSTDTQQRFEHAYFAMNQNGLHNLLALLADLSWYKNWLIDHRRGP